ncbi:MAG: electron transport complex subunit RsxG [Candidatus Obscuribacterales bacterium]|nr:electron transport complex subunit RsxG [Steroidobacteraceae bacterium]
MATLDRHVPLGRARSFALLVVALLSIIVVVTLLAQVTRNKIARNERAWLIAQLDALVPTSLHDNDMFTDRLVVNARDLLGADSAIAYRARNQGNPVAVVLTPVAPDGYGGRIELLVAIAYDGSVLGVHVLSHHETPGIGDGFEPRRTAWLQSFNQRSLANPEPTRWTIRKDGGGFDQFTGASVTPRAIIKTVRRTLEYYRANREALFNAASEPKS